MCYYSEPGYNDIVVCDTSLIASDIFSDTNSFLTVNGNIILLGYNDARL